MKTIKYSTTLFLMAILAIAISIILIFELTNIINKYDFLATSGAYQFLIGISIVIIFFGTTYIVFQIYQAYRQHLQSDEYKYQQFVEFQKFKHDTFILEIEKQIKEAEKSKNDKLVALLKAEEEKLQIQHLQDIKHFFSHLEEEKYYGNNTVEH